MSIKVITEPSVRLVGRLSIDEDELGHFLKDEEVESWTTDTDNAGQKLVEVAGRLCYKSYAKPRPGGNAAYLGHILEVGHGSVIEHAVYNFIITGVSRSFTHELVRHRAGWAYSQRSQRFCDEAGGSMVLPPFIQDACRREFDEGSGLQRLVQEMRRRWHYSVSVAQEQYAAIVADAESYLAMTQPDLDKTLRRKRAREAARSVLPNAAETQIFVTVNARAARHFIEARGDEHADAEIRSVALKMLAILQSESPNLFGDYVVETNEFGVKHISTPYHKV